MVILRDLDNEDERNPPRPLIIGSPLERQVREHFTRPDGSFNYSGYFAEAMGDSFSPRELEGSSGDDDLLIWRDNVLCGVTVWRDNPLCGVRFYVLTGSTFLF
ncbi:hypothetical protein QL285_022315 [Trifolium repens]|nr:hypothetical protein QL285_022315 [Trifolium repens]